MTHDHDGTATQEWLNTMEPWPIARHDLVRLREQVAARS